MTVSADVSITGDPTVNTSEPGLGDPSTTPEPTVDESEACQNLSSMLLSRMNEDDDKDSANAYLYIIFVLMCYASSIVVLMIKYVRKERGVTGKEIDDYFEEFIERERFRRPSRVDKEQFGLLMLPFSSPLVNQIIKEETEEETREESNSGQGNIPAGLVTSV